MSAPRIAPLWTFLADTLEGVPICRYRPITSMVIDGTRYFSNGWNQSWYADISAGKLFPLGSVAPTTFALALSAAGVPAALPAGETAYYYTVFRNNNRQEETAPQLTVGAPLSVVNGTAFTRDVTVTWTDPADGRWTHAAIYKRRRLASEYVLVAEVAIATATYLDVTPDASLSTAQADRYVPRMRTTLAPIFKVTSPHMGRVLGITGKDSIIYFSQAVRPDGELVQTDFPSGNILVVEPDDGLGVIVTIFGHYDTTIVVKERGCYLLEGDPATNQIAYRRMYEGRGALSPRAFASVHSAFVLGDSEGPYGWSPSAEPAVLGTRGAGNAVASPLAPLWARVNRGAADMVHLVHREEKGQVDYYLPLDYEPIAMRAAIWNYRENRFDGLDDRVELAAGTLLDASSAEHECYLDDLGFVWERSQDDVPSQGVEAGSVRVGMGLVSTPTSRVATTSGAFSLDTNMGPGGSPTERRDASGNLIDTNRIWQCLDTQAVYFLYWKPTAYAVGQTLDVGVIPFTPEFAASDFRTSDRKTVQSVIVRFRPQPVFLGITPTLNVYSGVDERAYALRRAINLTNTDGWALVPCWDRGFKWNLKMQANRAGDHVEIEAITADVRATRLRR